MPLGTQKKEQSYWSTRA